MKKILLLAGIIFFCSLVLGAWFFLGELGDFAKFLGQKSQGIVENEKIKFIGKWTMADDENYTITFFSDGRFIRDGYVRGTYRINNGRLLLNTSDDTLGIPPGNAGFTASYDYDFSDDDQMLTLTTTDTGLVTIYTKIQ